MALKNLKPEGAEFGTDRGSWRGSWGGSWGGRSWGLGASQLEARFLQLNASGALLLCFGAAPPPPRPHRRPRGAQGAAGGSSKTDLLGLTDLPPSPLTKSRRGDAPFSLPCDPAPGRVQPPAAGGMWCSRLAQGRAPSTFVSGWSCCGGRACAFLPLQQCSARCGVAADVPWCAAPWGPADAGYLMQPARAARKWLPTLP
jgi:hypothetical protein